MTSRTKGHPQPVRVTTRAVPRWLSPSSYVLSVLGLLAACYLTYEHLTSATSFACPEGEVVNCVKVTTSQWSSFMGIPVAYLGLLFFVPLVILSARRFFVANTRTWDYVRLGWTFVGLAMALYLVWAELFKINAICLWCTVVHVITFLLFVLYLFGQALIEAPARGARTR